MNKTDETLVGSHLAKALCEQGIEELSRMQRDTIEQVDSLQNVQLHSPTGSGKTLAFLLPLFRRLQGKTEVGQVVIVEPSRELALQVYDVARALDPEVTVQTFYGGRPVKQEVNTFEGRRPQILIGTPGRICDHLHQRTFVDVHPQTLVVDEYDKCLQMGFEAEMNELAERFSVQQYVITSATKATRLPSWPGLTGDSLHRIKAEQVEEEPVKCWTISYADKRQKDRFLEAVLLSYGQQKTIVFVNERDAVEPLTEQLRASGFSCVGYYGTMEQTERERMLFRFRSGCACILVATDLAARGLDIEEVTLIVHYDAPLAESIYQHRIGRSSRWMSHGVSVILLEREQTLKFEVGETIEPPKPEGNKKPAQPENVAVYIGKGKKSKVSKGDVLGLLCKEKGVPSSAVGSIIIAENYSLAAVERKAVEHFLEGKDPSIKIKGVKTHLQLLF